ncbi:hypothetical protein BIFGAL_03626 [Bifidobacterium gallicum DSM 20093 = LMG 11596]|uniref:Uncharacterized protein n=1 Tax=Bifidobacterium gallicum DSM 20093 = LMG 11596 TaxID=561180 RepID=D1NUV0_9BIFI|nr:hypothetical protein BIFGAL_03626 [Bifidobacterium gallicum DSM 20093 = LMG 11596]
MGFQFDHRTVFLPSDWWFPTYHRACPWHPPSPPRFLGSSALG